MLVARRAPAQSAARGDVRRHRRRRWPRRQHLRARARRGRREGRVLDRADFPRVKLCAGWLSPAIWDVLELAPARVPARPVGVAHLPRPLPRQGPRDPVSRLVHPALRARRLPARRSGAELHLGRHRQADQRERRGGLWSSAGCARATSSAPAARTARSPACSRPPGRAARSASRSSSSSSTPPRSRAPASATTASPSCCSTTIGGYGWNVPKSDWINVGCGTLDPGDVRDAWAARARSLRAAGHLPRRGRARARARQGPLVLPVRSGPPRRARIEPTRVSSSVTRSASPTRSPPRASCRRPCRAGSPPRRSSPAIPRATRRGCAATRCSPTTAASTRVRELGARSLRRAARRARPGLPRRPARRCAAPRRRARSRAASPGCSRARGCRRRASSISCSPSARLTMRPVTATQKLLSRSIRDAPGRSCRELLASAGITVGGDRAVGHPDPRRARVVPRPARRHARRRRGLRGGLVGRARARSVHRQASCAPGSATTLRENWMLVAHAVRARILNLQSIARAFENGQQHYDIGNDLYEAMLDGRLLYTCAYWPTAPRPRRGAGRQARPGLPQDRPPARHARARPRLRLGRLRGVRRRALRRRASPASPSRRSRSSGRASTTRTCRSTSGSTTTATRPASTTPSCRSASWSTSAPRTTAPTWSSSIACLAPGGVAFVHTIGGNRTRRPDRSVVRQVHLPQRGAAHARAAHHRDGGPASSSRTSTTSARTTTRTLMAWWERFDAAWPTLRATLRRARSTACGSTTCSPCAGAFRSRSQQLFQIVMTRDGTTQPAGISDARLLR